MKNKLVLFILILIIIVSFNTCSNAYTIDLTVVINGNTLSFVSSDVQDITIYNNIILTESTTQFSVRCYDNISGFRLVQSLDNTDMYYIVSDTQFSFLACTTSKNSISNLNLSLYGSSYNATYNGYVSIDYPLWNISTVSNYSTFTLNNQYDFSFNSDFEVSGDIIYTDNGGSPGGDNGGNNNGNEVDTNTVTNSVVIDYTDILGRIDNTTQATNNIVNGIDTSILEIQNTLNDSYNKQDDIANDVSSIHNILAQNNNEVISEIQSSSNTTQQYIQEQTNQSATQFNIITDTNNYNQNNVNIDTSFVDITDINGVDAFIDRIMQLFSDYFYGLSNEVPIIIRIPVPYSQGIVTLSTESITNFYYNNPTINYFTTMIWYVAFGLYIFRLAYTLWYSTTDGSIFRDTEGIVTHMDESNIIKYFML